MVRSSALPLFQNVKKIKKFDKFPDFFFKFDLTLLSDKNVAASSARDLGVWFFLVQFLKKNFSSFYFH